MSVQLDILTYDIEIDFISDNDITLNFLDGVTVYQNGTKVGTFRSIDFRDGTNTTAQVDNQGNKARIYINSTASGGGGGSSTWGSITGTLSNQTDLQSALNNKQDLDIDLTAIAALSTTSYGRALLTLANSAAADWLAKSSNLSDLTNAGTARTNLGLGTGDTPTFTGAILSGETASTIASFDGSKNIKSLSTGTYPSLTELSYVKGVTSAIQTQINQLPGNNLFLYYNFF